MARGSKKKGPGEEKPKESEFKKFVKKRAPIYLAVVAIVVVFIVPELTKGDLQSHLPKDLTAEQARVLDALLGYRGPDGGGLSVSEALSEKIAEEYPDENVFDHKKTVVDVSIIGGGGGPAQVMLNFTSHKGHTPYSWDVDADAGQITGNNPKSKHIVDLVDYYD